MGPAAGRPLLRSKRTYYFFFLVLRFFRLVVLFLAAFLLVRFLTAFFLFLFTAILTSGGSELRLPRCGQTVLKEPYGSPVCPDDGWPGELPADRSPLKAR